MSNSVKTRYCLVLIVAVALPFLALNMADISVIALAILLSCGAVTSLFFVKPSPWLLVFPFALCVAACFFSKDYMFSALAVALLPSCVCAGVCMRRRCSRGQTIVAVVACIGLGVFLGIAVIVFALYGSISYNIAVSFNRDYLVPLKGQLLTSVYDSIHNSMEQLMAQLGEEYSGIDVSTYSIAYIKSLRPMSVGIVLFSVATVAYLFTELIKQVVKVVDENKLKNLPGIEGKWEYVLSKGSAVAFIIAYFCMFIGGETLKIAEATAFYAIVMTILGGVLVMAFRSIKNRIKLRGWGDLIFPAILIVLFLSDYIITILTVIGLVASFRVKAEDDEKCKK